MVLLHGLTESGTTWPDLVEALGSSWDLIAPDLRGHGTSPRFTPQELIDPAATLVRDVLAVLAESGPAVVWGHSLGGHAALRAGLAAPELVRALVLEDPAQPSGSRALDLTFAAGTEEFLNRMADQVAELARMRRETTWSEPELLAWAESKAQTDRAYVRRGSLFGDSSAWEELFAALRVPTLLVLPPNAPMAPRADLVANPLVQRVVIPDSGHCVRRDQPRAVFAAVAAFLASL